MRARRLLSLLLLLQSRGHGTAREVADELGVSLRTVYRDLEALGSAGIPVVTERGPGGGCRLLHGYRTQLTGLDTGEAEALFLVGLPGPAAELGLGSLLAGAQRKLLAALPARLRAAAVLANQRFHLDARGWFQPAAEHPALEALAAAVWGDRRVRFAYERGDGRRVEREVDAIALGLKAGLWYLVGRDGSAASCGSIACPVFRRWRQAARPSPATRASTSPRSGAAGRSASSRASTRSA